MHPSSCGSDVKSLPAIWEIQVQFLGWVDPLEKEMAAHSNVFAWKIPWMEKPGRLQSMGSQRVGHDWASNTHMVCFTTEVDKKCVFWENNC